MTKKLSKVQQEIADALAAGGYIKVAAGTLSFNHGRSVRLKAYVDRSLHSSTGTCLRKLTEFQIEQAAKHLLIDLKAIRALPHANCFDPEVRTARLWANTEEGQAFAAEWARTRTAASKKTPLAIRSVVMS